MLTPLNQNHPIVQKKFEIHSQLNQQNAKQEHSILLILTWISKQAFNEFLCENNFYGVSVGIMVIYARFYTLSLI